MRATRRFSVSWRIFPDCSATAAPLIYLIRPDVGEVLEQRNIYRLFAEIVDYGDEYQGLRKLAGRENEVAGVVVPTGTANGHGGPIFDPHLSDAFCQVAGVWANFLTTQAASDAYLANGIGQWIRVPPKDNPPAELQVFATTHRSSDKVMLSDVFVFDAADGALLEVMLDIAYNLVSKSSMSKLLRRLSDPQWLVCNSVTQEAPAAVELVSLKPHHVSGQLTAAVPLLPQDTVQASPRTPRVGNDVLERVKTIIAGLSDLETHEIKADSELADLGIDSLVGMELITELEAAFEIKLPESETQAVVDMPGLMKCSLRTLGAESEMGDE